MLNLGMTKPLSVVGMDDFKLLSRFANYDPSILHSNVRGKKVSKGRGRQEDE